MNLIRLIKFFLIPATLTLSKPHNKVCGLPDNINIYPNYIIEELQVIWKNYVSSSNCDTKYLLTQNVLRLHNDIVDHLSEQNEIASIDTTTSSYSIAVRTPQAFGSKSMPIVEKLGYHTQPEQSYFFSNSGNFDSKGSISPITTTGEDAPGPYLNTEQATFLRKVTPQIRNMFLRLFYDPDIPSESLRDHKLHMLAVSMLDEETLKLFDNWAVNRRKALKDISSSIPKKNA
uniref:Uncharacterized protein n=1 Tax=Strongyloides venezuelensis TaxID=75913 RepID=A0A0K0EXB0_STRVS